MCEAENKTVGEILDELKDSMLFNLSLANTELFHSNFLAWLWERGGAYADALNAYFFPKSSGDTIIVRREEKHLDFPVLADDAGIIADRFGVSGVPTSFIVEPDGSIAFTEVGYTTKWGLRLRLWMAGY